VVLLEGAAGAAPVVEKYFQHALDWTRRQGILSIELRCAVGLARLWHAQGRTESAREFLAPVYGRFTEGFGTADLRAAKVRLDSFG
jgi:predicted ATPase